MPLVVMIHNCSPAESTRPGCIYASCSDANHLGVYQLGRGARAAFMHHGDKGRTVLKHYVALKGLSNTKTM